MLDDIYRLDTESPRVMTDTEVADISPLHTKIMQLAEVYLAYELEVIVLGSSQDHHA